MNSKIPAAVILATCITASGIHAQQPNPPAPPPSAPSGGPSEPGRPPGPPPLDATRPSIPGDKDSRLRDQHAPPREGGRGFGFFTQPPAPKGPRAFVGVVTDPVPPELSAQLGLQEGFGLLVRDVLPDSPASAAGIQKYDVLKMMDDQQLVDPGQFATLVRAAGKDKEVSITLLRKGQEQKVTLKVGERILPERRRFDFGNLPFDPEDTVRGLKEKLRPLEENAKRMQERAKEYQERAKEMQKEMLDRIEKGVDGKEAAKALQDQLRPIEENVKRMQERAKEYQDRVMKWQEKIQEDIKSGKVTQGAPMLDPIPPGDILKEAKPEGGGKIKVFGTSSSTVVDGQKARLMLKDEDGEVEVSVDNGKRTLTAKDPTGKVVFSGPVNTEEERKAVPEKFAKKLDQIQVRQDQEGNGVSASVTSKSGGEEYDADEVQ